MKKITITLGNNESKFTTMVDSDLAKRIFGDTVLSLIGGSNKIIKEEVTPIKAGTRLKEDNLIDALQKSATSKLITRGAMTEMKSIPTPYKPYDEGKSKIEYDSPRDPNKKHLCYYECRGCNKTFFKMACFGEEISCSCGEKSDIEHFTQGIYKCACCGFNGFFKVVNGSEVSEVVCKGCESPIDMKYNTDKGQWLSLNMFR